MRISSALSLTGTALILIVIFVLATCGVLPLWCYWLVYLLPLGACWGILTYKLWPQLSTKTQGWFTFSNYFLPWVAAASFSVLLYPEEAGFWTKLSLKFNIAFITGIIVILIYNFINKTKQK